MTAKRKERATLVELRSMCKNIADDITEGKQQDYIDQPRKEITAHEWMEDVYNIRYIVDSEKKYLGAMLMVAGGGPTIWVNTWTNEVAGYWGGDRVTWSFRDEIGLDDYNEEMYNCS